MLNGEFCYVFLIVFNSLNEHIKIVDTSPMFKMCIRDRYQSVEKQKEKVEESEKQEQSGAYETVEDAYQYLYDKVLSLSYSSSSPQYNAKGNFYAVLETGTGNYHEQENVPYTIEVVYDRISDDGDVYKRQLLDLMIPKISGMDVMQYIRKNSVVPVIIVSAKDTEADKTLGLGLGADDLSLIHIYKFKF